MTYISVKINLNVASCAGASSMLIHEKSVVFNWEGQIEIDLLLQGDSIPTLLKSKYSWYCNLFVMYS